MNSKQKGKRGELELSHKLQKYGFNTKRGIQYQGSPESPDVVGLPGIHIECKRVEKLNIDNAMEQSKKDSGKTEIPCVFHRKNKKDWLVTMCLNDFIKLYKGWMK